MHRPGRPRQPLCALGRPVELARRPGHALGRDSGHPDGRARRAGPVSRLVGPILDRPEAPAHGAPAGRAHALQALKILLFFFYLINEKKKYKKR